VNQSGGASLLRTERVYISVHPSEDGGTAVQLKEALGACGISAFVVGEDGDHTIADIACAIDACELFVVIGTRGYGMPGNASFSTRQELQFAVDKNKPVFLIKRCDKFEDPLTRANLPDSMLYQPWDPFTDMPGHLVDTIRAKLEVISVVGDESSAASVLHM
jgi:hypothetical protein